MIARHLLIGRTLHERLGFSGLANALIKSRAKLISDAPPLNRIIPLFFTKATFFERKLKPQKGSDELHRVARQFRALKANADHDTLNLVGTSVRTDNPFQVKDCIASRWVNSTHTC